MKFKAHGSMNDGCSKDHQASSRALQRIVRIGSSGKRSRPAAVATEAELNAWDRRVELIPALVPRGREAVQQPLQQKVIRRGGLAGTRYPRGGGGESGRRPGASAEAGPAGAASTTATLSAASLHKPASACTKSVSLWAIRRRYVDGTTPHSRLTISSPRCNSVRPSPQPPGLWRDGLPKQCDAPNTASEQSRPLVSWACAERQVSPIRAGETQ